MSVVFVDIETTGLDPERHEPWEIALINEDGEEVVWHVKPHLGIADPNALRLTDFYERLRTEGWAWDDAAFVAGEIARITAGRHLVGAVVSFDAERLERFLRRNGQCPAWHYHLVDVEALAAGRLGIKPPWDSDFLSASLGLGDTPHTHKALDDARWAKAIYEAVLE